MIQILYFSIGIILDIFLLFLGTFMIAKIYGNSLTLNNIDFSDIEKGIILNPDADTEVMMKLFLIFNIAVWPLFMPIYAVFFIVNLIALKKDRPFSRVLSMFLYKIIFYKKIREEKKALLGEEIYGK